jgi:hypothetical protein
MQYEVKILDLQTSKIFYKYFKNDYFLRLFINKAKRSKKIQVLGVKNLFR